MTITEYEYAATTVRALMAAEAAMALRSRPAIQQIDLGPGDRPFDAGEVIVK